MIGNGTGAVNVTGAGTTRQCLTSNGASADPTFQSCGAGGGVTTTGSPANHGTAIFTGSTTITSISPGTSGQCLTSNGASADPSYQTCDGGGGGSAVMARVTHNASQTFADSTTTPVAFNTDIQNPNSLHSTSTNNTRLTNNTGSAKTCHVTGSVQTQWTNVSGVQGNVAYVLEIWLKCTTLLDTTGVYQIRIDSGASDITSQVSSIRLLANNDYVESKIVNVSTATITVPATSEYTPIFSMICQ